MSFFQPRIVIWAILYNTSENFYIVGAQENVWHPNFQVSRCDFLGQAANPQSPARKGTYLHIFGPSSQSCPGTSVSSTEQQWIILGRWDPEAARAVWWRMCWDLGQFFRVWLRVLSHRRNVFNKFGVLFSQRQHHMDSPSCFHLSRKATASSPRQKCSWNMYACSVHLLYVLPYSTRALVDSQVEPGGEVEQYSASTAVCRALLLLDVAVILSARDCEDCFEEAHWS